MILFLGVENSAFSRPFCFQMFKVQTRTYDADNVQLDSRNVQ